jgi:hypothetical protein
MKKMGRFQALPPESQFSIAHIEPSSNHKSCPRQQHRGDGNAALTNPWPKTTTPWWNLAIRTPRGFAIRHISCS